MTERPWFVFRTPGSLAHVPAGDELEARGILERHSYPGAPVATWPLVATRVASREALVASLLRTRTRAELEPL